MTLFFGYKRLQQPADWAAIVGERNWTPPHSAYLLSKAWHTAGGMPAGIANALESSGIDAFKGLRMDVALVERPVFLDTRGAPSMTDLMGYGRNAAGEPVIIAVEGKAQERFGLPMRSWLRGDEEQVLAGSEPRPTRQRRYRFLCDRLRLSADLECGLRYQLFHRTVSAVMEAELHGAAAALVVVHAFGEHPGNWQDYNLFLEALGLGTASAGKLMGPARLGTAGATETWFLWWQDPLPSHVA